MDAVTRRKEIVGVLITSQEAISARRLAERLGVSRQVIVGDVALLRAEGNDIFSTPRGYLMAIPETDQTSDYVSKIVCQHTEEQTQEELEIIVDNGGKVLNVEVEHSLYGHLAGTLRIASRHDVQDFLKEMHKHESRMLASLTGGIHIHTIQTPDKATLDRIKEALSEAGILYTEY